MNFSKTTTAGWTAKTLLGLGLLANIPSTTQKTILSCFPESWQGKVSIAFVLSGLIVGMYKDKNTQDIK